MICSLCYARPPIGKPCHCGKHLIPTENGYLIRVTKPKSKNDDKTDHLAVLKARAILVTLRDSFSTRVRHPNKTN